MEASLRFTWLCPVFGLKVLRELPLTSAWSFTIGIRELVPFSLTWHVTLSKKGMVISFFYDYGPLGIFFLIFHILSHFDLLQVIEYTFLCCTVAPCFLSVLYVKWSRSVVSDPLWSHGLLLHPWDFPGKSTGVDCHFLLQGIFTTQRSNLGLLHCRQKLYHLSHQGSQVLYVVCVYM